MTLAPSPGGANLPAFSKREAVMKIATTLALLMVINTAALAQESSGTTEPESLTQPQYPDSCEYKAAGQNPLTAVVIHQDHPSRLRRLRARLANAARLTGHITQEAL